MSTFHLKQAAAGAAKTNRPRMPQVQHVGSHTCAFKCAVGDSRSPASGAHLNTKLGKGNASAAPSKGRHGDRIEGPPFYITPLFQQTPNGKEAGLGPVWRKGGLRSSGKSQRKTVVKVQLNRQLPIASSMACKGSKTQATLHYVRSVHSCPSSGRTTCRP